MRLFNGVYLYTHYVQCGLRPIAGDGRRQRDELTIIKSRPWRQKVTRLKLKQSKARARGDSLMHGEPYHAEWTNRTKLARLAELDEWQESVTTETQYSRSSGAKEPLQSTT